MPRLICACLLLLSAACLPALPSAAAEQFTPAQRAERTSRNANEFRSSRVVQIVAIGVTAAIGTVLVDASGRPLGPICTWQDQRATREATLIESRLGADSVYGISGRRIAPAHATEQVDGRRMQSVGDLALLRPCAT